MSDPLSDFFKDEQDAWSMGRVLCALAVVWTLVLVTLSGARVLSFSQGAYTLLGGIVTMLIVWAAGPRMAQYLAPRVGELVGALGKAKADREPDLYRDDERGEFTEREPV